MDFLLKWSYRSDLGITVYGGDPTVARIALEGAYSPAERRETALRIVRAHNLYDELVAVRDRAEELLITVRALPLDDSSRAAADRVETAIDRLRAAIDVTDHILEEDQAEEPGAGA